MSSRRRPTCTRCRASIRCCGERSTKAGCPSLACSKRCSLSSEPAPTASSRTSRWMRPKPCGVRSALLLLSWFMAAAALAAYPEKPIRFVIPSAAGGSPDVLMRVMTQQLSTQIGVPFIVENKPGASFTLGTMDVVRAAPDGYTLGYGNIVSLAINRSLLEKVPYDVEKDLTLVSNCVRVFNLLAVNNKRPDRQLVVDREEVEHAHAVRHQRQILLHVVGHFLQERAVDGERNDVAVAERVAVGGGPHHVHRAEGERGARLVLDDERHADLRGKLLRHHPHQDVGRAAGRRRNDEANRLFRIGGKRRRGHEPRQQ